MKSNRRKSGSAIIELGPALYIFLILVFFPALDLIGMAAQFTCAWYHNHLMLEELSVRKKSDGANGTVHNEVYGKFAAQGIGQFVGIQSCTDTVAYTDANPPAVPVATVSCTSVINGKPFISLPVIGFTQTNWTISSEATREDTNNN